MTATTTLWDMKNLLYQQMNETSNNKTYTNNDRDTNKLNDIVRMFCNGFVVSKLDQNVFYKTKNVPFLRKQQFFQYKQQIMCSQAIAVWDTEIYINTTDLDNSGAIYGQGIVITYTSKDSEKIMWCTGVVSSFQSGSPFVKCFPVNPDFDRSFRVFNQYNSVYREVFETEREDQDYQRGKYRSFMIVDNPVDSKKYIVIRWFANNDRFLLKYYEKVDNMTNETDICIVPDEYCLKVIVPIAAGELLMESETEDAEYMTKLTIGYANLQEAYAKFTKNEVDEEQRAKMRPYNYSSINSFGQANTRYTRSGFTVY